MAAAYSLENAGEEMLHGAFSLNGKVVFLLSTSDVLYIFETHSGKLLSMLHMATKGDDKLDSFIKGAHPRSET